MKIIRVNSLPLGTPESPIVANAIYLLSQTKGGKKQLQIHVSNTAGTELVYIPTETEILGKTITYSNVAPEFPCDSPFWMNTDPSDFSLYVQYTSGPTTIWMDLQSYMTSMVPEFAGTGVANTMARSDHNHDDKYVSIDSNHEW